MLVYFVLSLLASTLNEAIATKLGWRAKYLERWLGEVLTDETESKKVKKAVDDFLAYPLVTSPTKRGPSYIANEVFAAAVLTAGGLKKVPATVDEAIAGLPSAQLQRVARALAAETTGDVEELRARLERWYDHSMERVSGWYKRRVQVVLAVIGLGLAIIVNADSMQIVQSLWSDKTVRAAVVAEAGRVTQTGATPKDLQTVANQVKEIKTLEVPLGWKLKKGDPRDLPHSTRGWIGKIIGLLITALSLSLGAPFWFDLLSRVARIRISGAPPPPRDGTRTGEGEQPRSGPTSTPSASTTS